MVPELCDNTAMEPKRFQRSAKKRIWGGTPMKDFEMRYVGSHVEVYSGSGAFLFSADTVREAMEELAE